MSSSNDSANDGPNDRAEFGRATIEPAADVTAGSFGTWRLTVVAGSRGISAGGAFRVHTDTDSDWGTPQVVDPHAAEYLTVESPAGVRPVVTVTGVKSLRVDVAGRGLQPGEAIVLVLGDATFGGAGSRAQTFAEDRRFFWVDVDADGSGTWQTLADPPCVRIVGDVAVRLVVTAVPSTLAVGGVVSAGREGRGPLGKPCGGISRSRRGRRGFPT
jgi:hypothetical protein